MKICNFCKNEINDDAKFCPVCGAEQKSEPIVEQVQSEAVPNQPEHGTLPFGNSQPETMPFGSAQSETISYGTTAVNQPQPTVNSGTYFTPNSNVNPNTEMFNGGVPVQNVAQSKKGKGGKIAVAILVIIIAVFAGILSYSITSDAIDKEAADIIANRDENSLILNGTVDETGYTNSAVGLRIDCPEDWIILNNDEITEYYETYIDDEGKVVNDYGWIFEFVATNIGSNSDIIVESGVGTAEEGRMSTEEWLDIYMKNYEEDGDVMSEQYQVTIGSRTFNCFDCDSMYVKTPVKSRTYLAKDGRELFMITFNLYPEGEDEGVTLDYIAEKYFSSAE